MIYKFLPYIQIFLSFTKYKNWGNDNPSFLGYIPIFLLVACISIFKKDLITEFSYWKIHIYASLFNFLILPIITFLDAYRLSDYFIFSRLLVWSQIIFIINKKIAKKDRLFRFFIKLVFVLFFIMWFVFRMTKQWNPSYLMPYVSAIFI